MSYEIIALLMFSSMMVLLFTGQRVFAAIGFVAITRLKESEMLKEAMGEDVVAHYSRCAEWEQEEFDRAVTQWEIARGFEKA